MPQTPIGRPARLGLHQRGALGLPWSAWGAWSVAVVCLVGRFLPAPAIAALTAREYWYGGADLLTGAQIETLRTAFMILAGCFVVLGLLLARFVEVRDTPPATRSLRVRIKTCLGRGTQTEWVGVASATLAGAILRLWRLGHPIEFDEATTAVFFATRTLLDAVTDYTQPNNHVLYSVLARISTWVFGSGVYGLRLPAFVAGVLLIPASAWMARRFLPPLGTVATAFLVALWPALVVYGSLARGYSLATLLIVLAMGVASRGGVEWLRTRLLIVAGLLALAAWVVPVALMGSVTVGVWVLIDPGAGVGRARAAKVTQLAAVTVLMLVGLYGPIWLIQGWGPLLSNPHVVAQALSAMGPDLWAEFRHFSQLSGLPSEVLIVLLLGIGFGVVMEVRRGGGNGARLLLASLAGVVVLTAVTRRIIPARSLTVQLPIFFSAAVALLPVAGRSVDGMLVRRLSMFAMALLGAVSIRALSARPGVVDPLSRDHEAAASLGEAIRLAAPYAQDGYTLVVEANHGASDPARYYAKLAGLSPGLVRAPQSEEAWAEFGAGARLVLLRRVVGDGEPEGLWVSPFLDRLVADSTLGAVRSLGVFEDLDVVLVELR